MDEISRTFIDILKNVVTNEKRKDPVNLKDEEWAQLIRLVERHQLLPIFAETVWDAEYFRNRPRLRLLKKQAIRETGQQALKTAAFLAVYKKLLSEGIKAAILKGIILRSLYPNPEQRSSVDEDLLINPQDMMKCHRILISCGYQPDPVDVDPATAEEVAYYSSTGSWLEIHKTPFSSTSPAARCNDYFETSLERMVKVHVYGILLNTLCPTDHLLFLIFHAYKHLLFSGVGVRPILDIGMMSKEYFDTIDWTYVYAACESLNLARFATALFQIAGKHLGFVIPEVFTNEIVDETDLLTDVLDAGLYGTADADRIHSSRITLSAVKADTDKKRSSGIMASVFPGREYLEKHYTYTKGHPYLLPFAWAQRIITYLGNQKKNDPRKSLSLGRSRTELLREYGIISS